MLNFLEAAPAQSVIDYATLDFGPIIATVVGGIGAVAVGVITLIAARKGWSFVKSQFGRN